MQMSAALQGESQHSSPGLTRFTPTILPIVTSGEKATLQRMVSVDRTSLEHLATSISSHQMNADVDTLFHIHDTSQQFESKRNGDTVGLIAASSVNPVYFLLFHTGLIVGSGERFCSDAGEHRK
jgi:hypothetical protein